MAAPLPLEYSGICVDLALYADNPNGQEFRACEARYKAYTQAAEINPDKFLSSLPSGLFKNRRFVRAFGEDLVECERLATPRKEGEDEATFHYRRLKALLLVRGILRECDEVGLPGVDGIRRKLDHAAKQLQKQGLPNANTFYAENAVERWYKTAQAAAAAKRLHSARESGGSSLQPSHVVQDEGLSAPLLQTE